MVKIDVLENKYFQNYIPVPYQLKCKQSVDIKPISVQDWCDVDELALLDIKKNEINDIEILKMSYLQFLNEAYFPSFPKDRERFFYILGKCLGVSQDKIQFGYNANRKIVLVILNEDDEITKIITSNEFDDIKKIILYQNKPDYDDGYISPTMKQIVLDYILALPQNKKTPTLEDKKVYIYSKKNLSIQEINEMPYRLFCKTYDMLYECEEYLSTRIIQASEKFDTKDKVEHPLYKIKPTIFEQVVGSKESLYQELNKVQ